jgi:hypothetical protein
MTPKQIRPHAPCREAGRSDRSPPVGCRPGSGRETRGLCSEKSGVPDFLCASAPSKHSVRPIETITPLSKKIGVSIDSTIADQDCPVLAQELLTDPKYDGKLVLICWHHGHLPELAFGLGAAGANVPNPWDPNVFNLILNLDYSKGSKPTVTQITEPF